MRRGGRGGEARTVMPPCTRSRLGIVRETKLSLPATCRGGEGRGAGQRCGVGVCGEGRECGGAGGGQRRAR